MAIFRRFGMGVLFSVAMVTASCEQEGSESQQAAQVADIALEKLDVLAENLASADGNRGIVLGFVDKAMAKDAAAIGMTLPQAELEASARFYMQAGSLRSEVETGLHKALTMNIFPVQREYYELQLQVSAAYADQISAGQSELKVLAGEKRPLDEEIATLLRRLVSGSESGIKNARARVKDLWAKMDKLKRENPGSFRPAGR